jgi:hypothetical protein
MMGLSRSPGGFGRGGPRRVAGAGVPEREMLSLAMVPGRALEPWVERRRVAVVRRVAGGR